MIEEAHAGLHARAPFAVEHEDEADVGFLRAAGDRGGARVHGSTSASARSSRTRATNASTSVRPSASRACASASDALETAYGAPAARSHSIVRSDPSAKPTRKPARPHAFENVRTTSALSIDNAGCVRS